MCVRVFYRWIICREFIVYFLGNYIDSSKYFIHPYEHICTHIILIYLLTVRVLIVTRLFVKTKTIKHYSARLRQ